MAGGLGGLGGFGSILGALGQSLLTSPRENPFQGLPQALQANAQQREHQAALAAMSTVAEKLGVPKELAASPEAMKLFINHINQTKLNQLRQQAAQGTSLVPPSEDADAQPAMSVPGLQGSSGIPTTFNVAGGGDMGGGMTARAPSFTMGGGRGGSTMVSPRAAVDPVVAGELPPHQAALLNAIAKPESGGKYNIRYTPRGGVEFAGFSTHPGIMEPTKGGQQSSAAGRYQFTKTTWDSLVGANTPFTPENQDRAAILLAQRDYRSRTGRDLDADLRANGMTPQIAKTLAPTWEGLRNPSSALAEYNASYSRYASGALNQRAPQTAAANPDVFAAPGLNINYAGSPNLRYGRTATANAKPFDSLVVHHTATPDLDSALSILRKGDPNRGGQSFGYHFYVDKDGSITQGAPLSARTNHVAGSTGFNNASAIGISLVGSGETTPAQEQAAAALGQRLAATYGISPTRIAAHGEIDKGHQEDEGRSLAEQIRAGVSAPRPTQLASADPNAVPLPSGGMRIGQGGPGTGQNGPDIGQSGAPLNQVAAGRGRSLSVPIPAQTNIPATPTTPATLPPTGTGNNRTKAWAQGELQRGMNILAASNGDPVLMKQAQIIIDSARKYVEPSDVAKRIAEAGLTGTPVGRALNAGLPATAVEQLTEQLIPGYVSPSTLEQKKYRSAEEERAYQHSKGEREFGSAEEERRYRRGLSERQLSNTIGQQALDYNLRTRGAELEQNKFNYDRYKTDRAYRQQVDQALVQQNFERQRLGLENQRFGLEGERFENTKEQQAVQNQQAKAALRQQREIATESHGIAQQSPAEKLGGGLNDPGRAASIQAGLAAETAQKAAETRATTTSKAQATAQATLPTAEAAGSTALEAIREIRNHPGRTWATGGTAIFSPYDIARPGGPTADFIALTKTLKGQLFKTAYETLKGEHGITDVEGEKATQAILNLDRTQSEEQFLKNLDTAEGILQKGVDTVRAKAGIPQQTPGMSSGDIAQSLANARAAIAKNPAARDAIAERLRAAGIDPRGL